MQENKRNLTLDVAKGIGILTVVLCHNWILYHNRGELSRVVFSFHMPLFFFISGIFFNGNVSFKDLCLAKASALLKPFYIVLTCVFLISWLLVVDYNVNKELLNIAYSSGATISWTPLWFLSHLFCVFILAWIIKQYVFCYLLSSALKIGFVFMLLLVGVTTINIFFAEEFTLLNQYHLRGLPFNLDIIFVTTPFFLLGYLLAEQVKAFKPIVAWVFLLLLTFGMLHYFFNETIELNAREYPNFIICTLQIISGIYLVFTLAYMLKKYAYVVQPLAYIGRASLYVLIFHFYPQHLITGIFHYHFPNHLVVGATVAMCMSIAISLLLWEMTIRSRFLRQLMLNAK